MSDKIKGMIVAVALAVNGLSCLSVTVESGHSFMLVLKVELQFEFLLHVFAGNHQHLHSPRHHPIALSEIERGGRTAWV